MIAPVVEALKYCNGLCFDSLSFLLLRQMASDRSKLKVRSSCIGDQ